MSLIHNERWKLTATALNGVAITTVAAGVIAPLVALSYGVSSTGFGVYYLVTSIIWLLTGAGLHMFARTLLRRMRE